MSSLRNAVQRRQHRERAQPAGREKWGLLEKHKDYSLRAADYNTKKAKLQRLREKARDRNPDEFTYGMMSEGSRTQGHHGARDSVKTSLSLETVKLLKTQDAGYLRVMGDKVRKQIEQLEKEVKLQEGLKVSLSNKGEVVMDDDVEDEDMDIDIDFESDEGPRNSTVGRKTVFVDSVEEQRGYVGGVNGRNEGGDRDERKGQDKTAEQQKSKKQIEIEERTRKELQAAKKMKKRAAESRQRKLQALKKQYQDITAAQQELDLQRAKMDHSVGGVNKYGVKWKVRERKS